MFLFVVYKPALFKLCKSVFELSTAIRGYFYNHKLFNTSMISTSDKVRLAFGFRFEYVSCL